MRGIFRMKRNTLGFLTFCFFTLLTWDVEAYTDRIIAIVNDEVITESELTGSRIFPEKNISFLIEKNIQMQTAKKKGIMVQPSEISSAIEEIKKSNADASDKTFEPLVDEIKEQLTLLKLLNREINSRITITDKELEEYYLANKRFFIRPEEVRVGYVYFSIKKSASEEDFKTASEIMADIMWKLKNNFSLLDIKKRFEGIREIFVEEDLDHIKKGSLLPELDVVAFDLNEGDFSDIIATPSGLYIIKVLDKKDLEYVPFEESRDRVKERFLIEKNEKLYREWLYDIKSTSYIEIKE